MFAIEYGPISAIFNIIIITMSSLSLFSVKIQIINTRRIASHFQVNDDDMETTLRNITLRTWWPACKNNLFRWYEELRPRQVWNQLDQATQNISPLSSWHLKTEAEPSFEAWFTIRKDDGQNSSFDNKNYGSEREKHTKDSSLMMKEVCTSETSVVSTRVHGATS